MKNTSFSKNIFCILLLMLILIFSSSLTYASDVSNNNLLINGSFENEFEGWIINDLSAPFIPITVTSQPTNEAHSWDNFFTINPTDGNKSLIHGFDGTIGTIRISQDVYIPEKGAVLYFEYRAGWNMKLGNGTENRKFDINIESSDGANLKSVNFLTADPSIVNLDTGTIKRSLSLIEFEQSNVRINFDFYIPENRSGPGLFQLDNVTLISVVNPNDFCFDFDKDQKLSLRDIIHGLKLLSSINDSPVKDQGWNYLLGNSDNSRFYKHASIPHNNDYTELLSIDSSNNTVLTGDVSGDSSLEIIVLSNSNLFIYNSQGTLLSSFSINGSEPLLGILADVDQNDKVEIGVGTRISSSISIRFYSADGEIIKQFSKSASGDATGRPTALVDGKVICDINAVWDLNPRGVAVFDLESEEMDWFYGTGTYAHYNYIKKDLNGSICVIPYNTFSPNNGASIVANGETNTDLNGMTYVINLSGSTKLRVNHGYISPYSGGSITNFFINTEAGSKLYACRQRGAVYYKGQSSIWEIDINSSEKINTYSGANNSGFVIGFADLDNDKNDEIIYSSTEATNKQIILKHDLSIIAESSVTGYIQFINDFLGTGSPQIYIADSNVIRGLDTSLNEVWNYSLDFNIRNTIVSDVNQDGINELIVNTQDKIIVIGIFK